MARITVEDCQQRVDNRFLLVQMAIKRVRQFREGYEPLVESKNKEVVTALREIAAASDGRYVPLATAGTAETTLGAIYRRFLRQVAAKEQAEEEELRATERFGFFLVPGLVLLLAAAFLSRGRFSGSVRRKSAE